LIDSEIFVPAERLAALNGEQAAIEHWQIKRDGGQIGIVEIIPESP
jgi:hypothetical protein